MDDPFSLSESELITYLTELGVDVSDRICICQVDAGFFTSLTKSVIIACHDYTRSETDFAIFCCCVGRRNDGAKRANAYDA
jgi:hypothetical protein